MFTFLVCTDLRFHFSIHARASSSVLSLSDYSSQIYIFPEKCYATGSGIYFTRIATLNNFTLYTHCKNKQKKFADFIKFLCGFSNLTKIGFVGGKFLKFWSFINLPLGHARSHKKFGPDRFSRFDVYWIQLQTNIQTPKPNLYIDIYIMLTGHFAPIFCFNCKHFLFVYSVKWK